MGLGMSYIFAQFLRPVVDDLGWSRAVFASFGGPMLLSMSLGSPLIGNLTDRIGPRWVLSLSTLLLGAALLAFGAMHSVWHFYLTGLVLGVALAGLGDIPVGAVASRWFSGGRGLALGTIYLGSNLGGSIVPVAAAALTAVWGWRAALQVIAPVAVAFILPFAAGVVRHPRPGEVAEREAEVFSEQRPALDQRAAVRTRSFWILAFTLFAFYFYYLGVLYNLPAFLTDLGLSDQQAAFGYATSIFVGIFGKLAMGVLADRVPPRAAALVNFSGVTLASLLLLRVDLPGALAAFLVIHGVAVAAENVTLPLLVAEVFGVRYMAQIYGWLMVTLFLGGASGPIFAGWAHDRFGSYDLAFGCFAALNAAALLGLTLLRREAASASIRARPST
jgi:MFS family permease